MTVYDYREITLKDDLCLEISRDTDIENPRENDCNAATFYCLKSPRRKIGDIINSAYYLNETKRTLAKTGEYAILPIYIYEHAAYQAEVVAQGSQLTYREAIPGMWTVDRYVNLLMGEIPRLTDNDAGYGPNGKNYIAHDDIPPEVRAAFERLQAVYGTQTRAPNPLYASK